MEYDFTNTSNIDYSALGGFILVVVLIGLAIGIFYFIATWKIYKKAGKPGWASIIPIYNFVVLFEIVGLPIWLIILCIIPFVNFVVLPVVSILTSVKLAKCFGKDIAFALGLIFLPFIFYPILAFGSATYQGPDIDKPQNSEPSSQSNI